MQYCLAISFFDKQNLFCMCQCKPFAQMVDIWKFSACCLKREKGFLILCSSSLIRDRSLTFFVAGIKTRGNTYMLRWSYKTIWIHFNLIFTLLFENLIAKMQNICNLIGWNSVHIFDIFNCYRANINGTSNAGKLGEIQKTFEFALN